MRYCIQTSRKLVVTIICCLLPILGGCSHKNVSFLKTSNRFELPETNGYRLNGGHTMALQYQNAGASRLEFSSEPDFEPLATDKPTVYDNHRSNAIKPSYAVNERLDVALRISQDESGYALPPAVGGGVKYQFTGASQTHAKAGNRAMALSANISYAMDKTAKQHAGVDEYHYDLAIVTNDIALIFGYRLIDNLQVYGGPFVIHHYYNSRSTLSDASGTVIDKQNKFGSAYVGGLNLGLANNFTATWMLMGEVAFSRLHWKQTNENSAQFGITLQKRL